MMRRSYLVTMEERGGLEERRGTGSVPESEKSFACWKKAKKDGTLVYFGPISDLPSQWLSILLCAIS